ncbi:MAG: hypothetical protein ACM3XO_21625 [Bacteroidota bacterium]
MFNKTLLVGVLAFGRVGIAALGVWLFKPVEGLRGTSCGESYPPSSPIRLARHGGSSFESGLLGGNIVLLLLPHQPDGSRGYTSLPRWLDLPGADPVHDLQLLLE